MKRQTEEDEPSFSSDDDSADDDMSTEETAHSNSSSRSRRRRRRRRRRPSGARKTNTNKNNQGEVISMLVLKEIKEEVRKNSKKLDGIKDEISEIRKMLASLTESHNDQNKRLEKLTKSCSDLPLCTNDTSADDSAAPRSQLNQGQPPRYKLVFKSGVSKSINKGQILEINVALVDCNNDRTVENGPLSSATVELVVISAKFNQHDNQYNWSREDFENNIRKVRQGNSATEDVDQSVTSTVSNGRFNLVHGAKCHNGSTIFSNSSNMKVRLGVMVVSPTDERVLEGLSSAFYVRGHDRPNRQCKVRDSRSDRQCVYSYKEQNVTMPNMQSISLPNSTQGLNIIGAQLQLPLGSTTMLSTQPLTSQEQALIQHEQVPHWQTMPTLPHTDGLSPTLFNSNFMGNYDVPVNANGTQYPSNQIVLPVQLIWDRPYVVPSKPRCNLLDQHKSNNCGLQPTWDMPDNFGSLSIKPKDKIMLTHRRSGVLIEHDDSDEERPLNIRLYNKYRLGFVNKVCETYYTMDPIKADDGNPLKVALFDENNTKVTFGPLSSASVEIVVLHGDFNDHDLDYWTREEFSSCVVCPNPGKEESVLGGDCTLVLVHGEACLSDVFFKKISFYARTGKFKMGVMLASAQDGRIQEGISEPFLVKHRPLAALPPGSRLHRQTYTDEKQIVHYMCHRRAAGSKRQCYPHNSGSKRQRVLERTTTQQKQQKLLNAAAVEDRRAIGTKNNVNDASSSSAGFTSFYCRPVALPVMASCSLLQRCFFCQAELFQGSTLYMYRGDRAFCSQTCRRKYIRREAMDCAWVAATDSSLHRHQQPLIG